MIRKGGGIPGWAPRASFYGVQVEIEGRRHLCSDDTTAPGAGKIMDLARGEI